MNEACVLMNERISKDGEESNRERRPICGRRQFQVREFSISSLGKSEHNAPGSDLPTVGQRCPCHFRMRGISSMVCILM